MRSTKNLTVRQRLLSSTVAPLLLAAVSASGVFSSCQADRSEFGAEFIPKNERHAMVTDSVGTLKMSSVQNDTSRVKIFTNFSLGEVYDGTFGKTKCALAAEFFPSSMANGFKPEMEATSTKLRLHIRNHFGKGQLKIDVYEATQATYDGIDKAIGDVPRGESLGSITVDESAKDVELELPKELGTRWMRYLTTNGYSPEKFCSEFPGLYIVAERVDASSTGLMQFFNISDANTRIAISWLNDKSEEQTLKLPIGSKRRHCNLIDNDISGSKLETAMGMTSDDQETSGVAYLMGDGGTTMSVDFSQFYDQWRAKGAITVQRAQLLIAADESSAPSADTIVYGLASFVKSGSKYVPIIDASLSSNTYSGLYDPMRKCYVLNVTSYIQHLLNDRNYPSSLHVFPASTFTGIGRLVVGTSHNAERPARLVITYTKL